MKFAYRFDIYLPLKYNDGADVEPERFQETRRELVDKFGGLTWIGNVGRPTILGFWRTEEKVFQDENDLFVVYTEREEVCIEFFRQYKEVLKKRFRQKEVERSFYCCRRSNNFVIVAEWLAAMNKVEKKFNRI